MPARPRKKTAKPRAAALRPKKVTHKPWWQELGTLRISLILMTFVVMALAPNPGTPAVYAGWSIVPTLMAPVLAPILLQVVLLDALMSRVWMSAYAGAARERYRRILWINLGVAALSTLWWLPYFLALFRGKGVN